MFQLLNRGYFPIEYFYLQYYKWGILCTVSDSCNKWYNIISKLQQIVQVCGNYNKRYNVKWQLQKLYYKIEQVQQIVQQYVVTTF